MGSPTTYTMLTAEERLGILRTRVVGAERDLYNVEKDLEQAGSAGNAPQESRAGELRALLENWRADLAELEKAAKAETRA